MDLYVYINCIGVSGDAGSLLLLRGLSPVAESRASPQGCRVRASHCGGFSCWGARAPGLWASVVFAHRL